MVNPLPAEVRLTISPLCSWRIAWVAPLCLVLATCATPLLPASMVNLRKRWVSARCANCDAIMTLIMTRDCRGVLNTMYLDFWLAMVRPISSSLAVRERSVLDGLDEGSDLVAGRPHADIVSVQSS